MNPYILKALSLRALYKIRLGRLGSAGSACTARALKRQQAMTAVVELYQDADKGGLIDKFPTQY